MMSASSPPQLSRIMAVFMIVMLLLVLIAPAAFADSYDTFVFETNSTDPTAIDSLIPEGVYLISLFIEDDGFVMEASSLDPVTVSYGDLGDGIYGFSESINLSSEFDGQSFAFSVCVSLFKIGNSAVINLSDPETGDRLACRIVFTLVPESSAVSQFLVYTTTTLSAVVSWFGNLIDSFIGENGALSVLFPFVAIGFTIALVYIGIKLVRQFVPGF